MRVILIVFLRGYYIIIDPKNDDLKVLNTSIKIKSNLIQKIVI